MIFVNKPIAFDSHGEIPFYVPFEEIPPESISLYVDIDTNTGKNTCGQKCRHCWFEIYEKVKKKAFTIQEGKAIADSLLKKGFNVFPRVTDSFAYQGEFIRVFGSTCYRKGFPGRDGNFTKNAEKGAIWTSGRPLKEPGWLQLLDLAKEHNYGSISITFHGILDENLNLSSKETYPIKGVLYGDECLEVIERIFTYNKMNFAEKNEAFRVNIGVTIGRHNYGKEHLVRYAKFFNPMGVNAVRFNKFVDHGGRLPALSLQRADVEKFYQNLKWLHANLLLHFQLAVSEDFGTSGIEVMGFPSYVGWCRAGRQLFGVIPTKPQILDEKSRLLIEKIGDVVACVNVFEPTLGRLIKTVNRYRGEIDYFVVFDIAAINVLNRKRMTGVYRDGCMAEELIKELVEKNDLAAPRENPVRAQFP